MISTDHQRVDVDYAPYTIGVADAESLLAVSDRDGVGANVMRVAYVGVHEAQLAVVELCTFDHGRA